MQTLKAIIPRTLFFQIGVCMMLIFISSAAETLGLGMIMPLLASLLGDGEGGVFSTMLQAVFGQALTINTILLIFVFLFSTKFILGVIRNYMMYGIEWKLRGYWMNTFYQHNTLKSYRSFESNKPGIITNEIINETLKAASALRQMLEFFSQVLLIVGLLTVLLISNFFYSSIFLLMAIVFTISIKFTIVNRVAKYGALRQEYEGDIYHEVNEMIHGMKTVRFLELESFLLSRFQPKIGQLVSLMRKNETIRRLPSQIVEILFISIFVVGLLLVKQDENFNIVSFLPFIGMLVMVSTRLFTNVGTVVSAYAAIASLWASVEKIYEIMTEFQRQNYQINTTDLIKKETFEDKVCFKNVDFFYQKGVPILKKLNVSFARGTFNVIIGPSGSGKSTLAKILIGLYKPSKGQITLDGLDINELSSLSLSKLISYVDQEHFFFNGTLLENLQHKLTNITEERINEALVLTNAQGFVEALPDGLNTLVGDKGDFLSTGQKARLAFARALLLEPKILVLDEITSALDQKSSNYIIQTILKLRKSLTIIAISHDPLVLDQAEKLYELTDYKLNQIK